MLDSETCAKALAVNGDIMAKLIRALTPFAECEAEDVCHGKVAAEDQWLWMPSASNRTCRGINLAHVIAARRALAEIPVPKELLKLLIDKMTEPPENP